MRPSGASRTAGYMALFRALESSRASDERLFDDPLASAFLDRRLKAAVLAARLPVIGGLVPRYIDYRWPGPRPSGIVRTRVIDDAVRAALRAGCSQLVLLGAGYDTRAYRLPDAAGVQTFEVDHPATQAAKRAVLEHTLGIDSHHVHFVADDFEQDSLESALRGAGLRGDARSCVVWEGVFSYLSLAAVDATLRSIVRVSAPGSQVILTYVDDAALQAPGPERDWIAAVRDAGEPFITGLDPARAADFFSERGLRLVTDESTRDSAQRLAPASAPAIPGFYRVALLEVGGAGT